MTLRASGLLPTRQQKSGDSSQGRVGKLEGKLDLLSSDVDGKFKVLDAANLPVRLLVFGFAGLMLVAVMGAMIALAMHGGA